MKNRYTKGLTSIVIPTWFPSGADKEKYVTWTLESLAETTDKPFEIIIFNNEAREETNKFLKKFHSNFSKNKNCKGFKIIKHTQNMGWTGGLELGIQASKGEYVCLSNDDLIYEKNWLSKMLRHFRRGVALIGPTSDFVSGLQDVRHVNAGDYEEKVNFLIGFCILAKRMALDSIIGGPEQHYIDPRFFPGGSEEIDLCYRLAKKGWNMFIAKNVFIHHFGNRTLKYYKEFKLSNPDQFFGPRMMKLEQKHGQDVRKIIEFQHSPKVAIGIPTIGLTDSQVVSNLPWLLQRSWAELGFNNVLPIIAPRNIVHIGRSMIVSTAITYGAEYLMFLDDDMLVQDNTIVRLYNHQKDFVSALAFKRTEPYFPCFAKGTLVETNDGCVKIEEIDKGDLVKTHTGRFKRVIGTSKTRTGKGENDKLVWVSTNNNDKNIAILRSTPEHPYYVLRNNTKQWIRAMELTTKDLMLYPYDKKKSVVVFDYSTYRDRKIHKEINADEDFARFLGLYLAEGCSDEQQLRFSFNKKEKEYIKFVSGIIKEYFDGKPSIMNNKDSSSTTIAITRKGIGNNFNEWFGVGANNKHIPEFVFEWDTRNKLSFLMGYLQGDGYIKNPKECGVRFTTASKKLADDVRRLCHGSGLKIGKIYCYKDNKTSWNNRIINSNDSYNGVISARSWYKLLDILDGKNIGEYIAIPIARKEIKQNHHVRYVYNLEVEDDNSYIVNSSAVHNCMFTGKDSRGAWLPDERIRQGLIEVDVTGLSCCLIKIDVIKELLARKEKEIFKRGGLFYFDRFGEDFNFCEELKKMGIKIWVDSDLIVDHLGKNMLVNDKTFYTYNEQQQFLEEQRLKNNNKLDEKRK